MFDSSNAMKKIKKFFGSTELNKKEAISNILSIHAASDNEKDVIAKK